MMWQIYDLETIEPQDIPIKVCVMFYKALLISYIEAVKK